MRVASVFGGSGFIGRYVVQRLAQRGYLVRVAARNPQAASFLRTTGQPGQVNPMFVDFTEPSTVSRVLAGADVAVNLVGILKESHRGDFQRVHAESARQIAKAAAMQGVQRLVHVSAIGADTGRSSRYAQSKADGEAAIHTLFPEACILRPSVVFGAEDQFFNLFAQMIRPMPFAPVVSPRTKLQPIYVGDVADAVVAGLERPDAAGRLYELGGPQILTMCQIMTIILRITGWKKPIFDVPTPLSWLLASLPLTPITIDQLRMLRHDNVASPGIFGAGALGITPLPVDMIVPDYLRRFASPQSKARRAFAGA